MQRIVFVDIKIFLHENSKRDTRLFLTQKEIICLIEENS